MLKEKILSDALHKNYLQYTETTGFPEKKLIHGNSFILLGKSERNLTAGHRLRLLVRSLVKTLFSLGFSPLLSEKCRNDWKSAFTGKRVVVLYASIVLSTKILADKGSLSHQQKLGTLYRDGLFATPKSYSEAAKYFKLAADRGDLTSQFELAEMYELGEGVQKSDEEAARYYKLAANQGHCTARFNLGKMYAEGRGVTKSDKKAFKYYQLAANQGHCEARYKIGEMYENGLNGVTPSNEDAFKYYKLAADGYGGNKTKAQYKVGNFYKYGTVVTQSYEEAFKYYQLAANREHTESQFCLGLLYLHGDGVAQSDESAFNYLQAAARKGHIGAIGNIHLFFHSKVRENGERYLPKEAVENFQSAANKLYKQYF